MFYGHVDLDFSRFRVIVMVPGPMVLNCCYSAVRLIRGNTFSLLELPNFGSLNHMILLPHLPRVDNFKGQLDLLATMAILNRFTLRYWTSSLVLFSIRFLSLLCFLLVFMFPRVMWSSFVTSFEKNNKRLNTARNYRFVTLGGKLSGRTVEQH